MFGTILGVVRFITEYVYPAPKCGEVDDRPGFVSMNFMYFGKLLPQDYSINTVFSFFLQINYHLGKSVFYSLSLASLS